MILCYCTPLASGRQAATPPGAVCGSNPRGDLCSHTATTAKSMANLMGFGRRPDQYNVVINVDHYGRRREQRRAASSLKLAEREREIRRSKYYYVSPVAGETIRASPLSEGQRPDTDGDSSVCVCFGVCCSFLQQCARTTVLSVVQIACSRESEAMWPLAMDLRLGVPLLAGRHHHHCRGCSK